MTAIIDIFGREILDSRGNPTVEVDVVLDGSEATQSLAAGTHFDVPANSGFTITVSDEPCHYVCSFLS